MALATDVKGGKMASTGIRERSCPLTRVNRMVQTVEEPMGAICTIARFQWTSTLQRQNKTKTKRRTRIVERARESKVDDVTRLMARRDGNLR